MKTIIAGSRAGVAYIETCDAIKSCPWFADISEFVSGGALGVDSSGEWFAKHETRIPVKVFKADWDKHGKAAGPIRNAEMADYADALILVWDGTSSGSKNMLVTAQKKGLKIHEKIITR